MWVPLQLQASCPTWDFFLLKPGASLYPTWASCPSSSFLPNQRLFVAQAWASCPSWGFFPIHGFFLLNFRLHHTQTGVSCPNLSNSVVCGSGWVLLEGIRWGGGLGGQYRTDISKNWWNPVIRFVYLAIHTNHTVYLSFIYTLYHVIFKHCAL